MNESQDDYELNDDLLVQCQGKPRCSFTNEALQKLWVEKGGCKWCQKIWFDSRGDVTCVIQPNDDLENYNE